MTLQELRSANGASLIIKLAAQISGPVATVLTSDKNYDPKKDSCSVKISESYREGKKLKWREKRVQVNHTSRRYSNCQKVLNLTKEQLLSFISNIPNGFSKKVWDKMKDEEKISKNLETFDEGFGVSLELY